MKECEFLDLRFSSQCAGRDVQTAVGSQKPELSTEVRNDPTVWEAWCLSPNLPSDGSFILALK